MSSLYLPKWPQMIVTGDDVTLDQASEIIRRTDSFFVWGGGNYHEWIDTVNKLTEVVTIWNSSYDTYDEFCQARHDWESKWQYIECEYVTNDWISCAFIYGPHGWCHPDGHIGYCDNVGKWPSIDEITEDWKKLATAFPFLNLTITLMNGENCEYNAMPVVHMVVRDGDVSIHPYTDDNTMMKLHGGNDKFKSAFKRYPCRDERAISLDTIKRWVASVFATP